MSNILFNQEGLNVQLGLAAEGGDLKSVRRLLKEGADLHADDDYALKAAADNGCLHVVKHLISHGADINSSQGYALEIAAAHGYVSVVNLLIQSGADVHAGGGGALRTAAHSGRPNVVELLLKAGADVHAHNNLAFSIAVDRGHRQLMYMLLAAGVKLTAVHDHVLSDLPLKIDLIRKHAATANGGFEAVMMLDVMDRISVLAELYPDLDSKRVSEELEIMEALGLDAVQMAAMWQDQHGATTTQQENSVTP